MNQLHPSLKKLSVLLIDDDEINNYINKRILDKSEITSGVIEKLNGEEAMKYLIENPHSLPGLIFLDLDMPVMNGIEFLEEFSKAELPEKSQIKIIVLSSVLPPSLSDALLNYPVYTCLTKPLTEEVLIENIERLFYIPTSL